MKQQQLLNCIFKLSYIIQQLFYLQMPDYNQNLSDLITDQHIAYEKLKTRYEKLETQNRILLNRNEKLENDIKELR